MKFFKHFTDAHRGRSMQVLLKNLGMAGVGRYWLFVELCAEKLHKAKDEEYTEAHCHFEFERAYLMRSLGYANLKQCSSYLHALAELGLCSVSDSAEVFSCSMPKLLECMDRDSKRARTERAPSAPKRKRKKEEKEKEYLKKFEVEATRLAEKYRTLFPGTTTGSKYLDRFFNQLKTPEDIQSFETSMDHYRRLLDAQQWRDPKTSVENYLGTKQSGFFWREFITMPSLPEPKEGDKSDALDPSRFKKPGGAA